MKKTLVAVLLLLTLLITVCLSGCDLLDKILGTGNGFDGICDYCNENASDPWYNENYTTSQRFDDTEICLDCFRSGVWMDE